MESTLTWTQAMAPALETANRTEDDATFVVAARNGDESAFGELVRRHQRRVFRLAGRFFRRPEEVEDIAQQTFLTAWRKLDTYRATAPFEHWLTRVCLNCCYEELRRRRAKEVELDRDVTAPRRDPDARLEVEQLLSHLPPADRFVLQLMHGEGWSTREIAERLGWSRANVKVRAHRARKKLRALLEEDLGK